MGWESSGLSEESDLTQRDQAGRNLSSQSPTQTIAHIRILRLREGKGRPKDAQQSSSLLGLPEALRLVAAPGDSLPVHQVFVEAEAQARVRFPCPDSIRPPQTRTLGPSQSQCDSPATSGRKLRFRDPNSLLRSSALCWRRARRSPLLPSVASPGHQTRGDPGSGSEGQWLLPSLLYAPMRTPGCQETTGRNGVCRGRVSAAARCEAGLAKAGPCDGGSTLPRRLRTVLLVGRPGPLPLHPSPLSEDKAWGVRFLQLTVSPTHCPERPENPAPLSESDVAGRWGVGVGGGRLRSSADGDVPVPPIPCLGLKWG